MNINHKNESQFELFPGASGHNAEQGEVPSQIKSLTLSLENIIVLSIIFVMMLVLFFSFGIEKGKTFAVKANDIYDDQITAQESLTDASVAEDDDGRTKIVIEQKIPRQEQAATEVPVKLEGIVDDIFTIQVASFKQETSAKQEANTLKSIGHETFVLAKGSYSIVCVGKFAQRNEAKQFSSKLKDRYRDLLVRRF